MLETATSASCDVPEVNNDLNHAGFYGRNARRKWKIHGEKEKYEKRVENERNGEETKDERDKIGDGNRALRIGSVTR